MQVIQLTKIGGERQSVKFLNEFFTYLYKNRLINFEIVTSYNVNDGGIRYTINPNHVLVQFDCASLRGCLNLHAICDELDYTGTIMHDYINKLYDVYCMKVAVQEITQKHSEIIFEIYPEAPSHKEDDLKWYAAEIYEDLITGSITNDDLKYLVELSKIFK